MTGPFQLRLSHGGRFGQAAWAAIDGDTAALTAFRGEVHSALTGAGFTSDDRPFTPHLTVSYAADALLDAALTTHEGAPWDVTQFALVESRSARYTPLQQHPLTRRGHPAQPTRP